MVGPGRIRLVGRLFGWLVGWLFVVLVTIRMNESRTDVPPATKGANANAQATNGANANARETKETNGYGSLGNQYRRP